MLNALRLNLRSKIMLILACYILGILGIGYVSNADLSTTEDKIGILELAYNLNNIILEARRYEKNFLLYNEEEAFKENARYLAQITNTIEEILARSGGLKLSPILKELNAQVIAYQANMAQLSQLKASNSGKYTGTIERLREEGKKMTEMSEQMVEFERSQIHTILTLLQKQLMVWSALAVTLGIILPLLMIYKIFRPLVIIKNATEDIAHGRFNRIEVINTRDEMQQVMEAFNTMVCELERRQDQLVQSKKLSSIGTLTAGVAHQLNNPLNNISTSCQIAIAELADADPEFLLRMLKNIDQETLRARDVVKGLLEFSRVQKFALRLAHLSDVVKRSIRLVQSQVPADIETVVRVPETLMIPMDRQRMQEVFINLIINAAQSIKGKGEIRITAWQDDQDEVIIEVHDSGPGIPIELQGRLFDPFYTTKEEGQGTGLGLSVVDGIIQQHQGNITVESIPDKGASFLIHLPLHPKECR